MVGILGVLFVILVISLLFSLVGQPLLTDTLPLYKAIFHFLLVSSWRNFYQASGGHLYVVCENRAGMRNIRCEINYCLGNLPVVISLTKMAELQAGKRGDSEDGINK